MTTIYVNREQMNKRKREREDRRDEKRKFRKLAESICNMDRQRKAYHLGQSLYQWLPNTHPYIIKSNCHAFQYKPMCLFIIIYL
jgi:hypothetical protein